MAVPTWQYWSITDCKKQLVTCSCFRLFTEQDRNADLGSHCNFTPWKCHLRHMSHDMACTVHIPSLQHICHTLTSSLARSQPRWQWLPLRKQMGWGQGAARCTMPRARKPRKQFQMHWCLACNLWLGLEVHETSKTYETTEKERFGNTDYSSCRSVRFWAFAIWHVFFDLLRWENWHEVDINQHLLATAEAPTLGSNIPMPQVPRRASLGNILPCLGPSRFCRFFPVFFPAKKKNRRQTWDRGKPCKLQSMI